MQPRRLAATRIASGCDWAGRVIDNAIRTMSQIFISYRRDDARGWAPGLHGVIARHFGSGNVFDDRRTIQGGDDWFAVIADSIGAADAVVVLIGPDWIGPDGGRATNRLSESTDVVRREIELALDADRWIVPVLLDARQAPAAAEIPASLQSLLALHMVPVRPDIFDEDAERLLALLISRLREPGQIRHSIRRRKFAWLIGQLVKGFGGRGEALERVRAFLEDPGEEALLVKAPAGFGKTSLLARIIGDDQTPLAFHMFNAAFDADSVTETDFLASMVEQLMAWQGLREQVQAADLAWLKGRFASLLKTLPARDHVAVLDGLDEINAVWDVRPYVEMLRGSVRLLASVRTGGPSDDAYGFTSAAVYVLGGFSTDEVKDVLASAGPHAAMLAADANAVAAVAKVAASEEPGVVGADPFVVRFIAGDLQRGDLTIATLSKVKSSGLTAYLNHWLDQMTAAAGDDERPMLLLGLLATARAPLPVADLERLLPRVPNRLVQPRLEQTLQPVRRFVTTVPNSGLQLVHARLADHLRSYLDVSRTRDLLIADCLDWRTHRSPYALRWLVTHLLDAGRLDEAWKVVTEEGPDGRNAWYSAEAAPADARTAIDRLAWYLEDLAALRDAFVYRKQPLERIITLALLQASVAAISERVPIDLLDLMASLGDGLRQRAVTLARRRAQALDRLRALAAVIAHVDDPGLQRALGAEAVATATVRENPRARSEVFTTLAPRLSADLAQRAVDLTLEDIAEPANVEAAVALAAQLPSATATQVHAALWTSIHDVQHPLEQASLLATYARLGLPDAERAVTEAVALVSAALENPSDSKGAERKLAAAVSELARVVEVPWDVIAGAFGAGDPEAQANHLRALLEQPGAIPLIPAVNHLIDSSPSEARGRALAAALPQLTEEDARKLAFGGSWDIIEFSWVVPALPETLRADAARTVLNNVLQETPSSHTLAEVLARITPFLDDADRASAIQYMEASAAATSLVPAHEEMSRQIAAMLKIRDVDSGRQVEFEMSAGPGRADTLTLVARTVERGAAPEVIERALQAAHAIDDRLHAALMVADLSRDSAKADALRLQHAAIDMLLGIEWDATRADGLARVAGWLAPDVREDTLARMTFEAPEARERAEASLLAARTPLSASDVPRLVELLPNVSEDHAAGIVEAMVGLLSDEQVTTVLETVLSWKETEVVSQAVVALAPRLPPARAVKLVTERSWSLVAVEALLARLPQTERQKLAPSISESVMNDPLPSSRALALIMLERLRLPGLDETNVREGLATALEQIDDATPPGMLAAVAMALPDGSPSRRRLIDSLFRRTRRADDADEWARALATLGAAIPPSQVSAQIDALEALGPARRTAALDGLSAAVLKHLTPPNQRTAAIHVLAMTHGDERRDVLSELHAMRPLLVSLLSDDGCGALADDILRVERWFP